jgi:predicted negative regulator of RcsB-dependent stress response
MSKGHPGARRRSHKKDHDPDDVFIAKTLELSQWAKNNQQLLTALSVVLILLIAGGIYYHNYQESLAQQAGSQLEQIHQTISLQDREGAKSELSTFLERFGNTAYAGEARLLLGQLYLETNDAQQALAVLEPMASSPRGPLELQAAMLLGVAYEQEERWQDAEEIYMTVADRSDLDFQVRNALQSAARIREDQGNVDGAIALYERILDDLPEDAQDRGMYQMRLAELKAENT